MHKLTVKVDHLRLKAAKNRKTHKTSFFAFQAAMYSVLVKNNTTVF